MAIYYIDFGAANDGDGTAYTQAAGAGTAGAYKTLVGKTFAVGDTVYIRRSATALALTTVFTLSTANAKIIGWPLAGDSEYASRPATPQAAWDGDAGLFAQFTQAAAVNTLTFSGSGQKVARLRIVSSVASGGLALFNASGANQYLERISTEYSAAIGTATLLPCLSLIGASVYAKNLYCKGASNGTSYHIASISTASGGCINDVTIDVLGGIRGSLGVVSLTGSGKPVVLERCTVNYLAPYAQHQLTAVTMGGYAKMFDCVVNGQASSSFEGPSILLSGDANVILNMSSTLDMGCIYNTGSNNLCEISNWQISYPMAGTNSLIAGYSLGGITSPIVLSESTTDIGNTIFLSACALGVMGGATAKVTNLGNNNTLMLNDTDFVASSVARTNGFDYSIFSMNHGRIAGNWHFENRHGTLDSVNTYRTGGANFGIKAVTNETLPAANKRGLPVSVRGREIVWVTLLAGTNILTLYGAHKNFVTTPTKADIGFSLEYQSSTVLVNKVSSLSAAALEADTSTWNNDPGLTAFKVSVTLTNAVAQTVPLNIFVSPEYDISGYVVIDPTIVVS